MNLLNSKLPESKTMGVKNLKTFQKCMRADVLKALHDQTSTVLDLETLSGNATSNRRQDSQMLIIFKRKNLHYKLRISLPVFNSEVALCMSLNERKYEQT